MMLSVVMQKLFRDSSACSESIPTGIGIESIMAAQCINILWMLTDVLYQLYFCTHLVSRLLQNTWNFKESISKPLDNATRIVCRLLTSHSSSLKILANVFRFESDNAVRAVFLSMVFLNWDELRQPTNPFFAWYYSEFVFSFFYNMRFCWIFRYSPLLHGRVISTTKKKKKI